MASLKKTANVIRAGFRVLAEAFLALVKIVAVIAAIVIPVAIVIALVADHKQDIGSFFGYALATVLMIFTSDTFWKVVAIIVGLWWLSATLEAYRKNREQRHQELLNALQEIKDAMTSKGDH